MVLELIPLYPRTSIILFAFLVSLFITIINKLILDQDKMKNLKEKQKELQKKMKEHKDNPEKLMELQKEMFSQMGETFKHSFKPMLITLIPLLIFFGWLRGLFAETTIAKTWIWYYIGSSIIFSMVLRKIFKMP